MSEPEFDFFPEAVSLAGGALVVSARTPGTATLVVRAEGEIDAATTTGWSRFIDAALRVLSWQSQPHEGAAGAPLLVTDLSAVSFLGASGLAVLVETLERARNEGIELRVVAGRCVVCRPLEATGLDRLLRLEPCLDDALRGSHPIADADRIHGDERVAG